MATCRHAWAWTVVVACALVSGACGDDEPAGEGSGDGSGDGSGEGSGDDASAPIVLEELPAVEGADDGDTGVADLAPLELEVGPEGGTLTAPADSLLAGLIIEVPPGALSETVTLQAAGTVDPTPLPDTAAAIGPQIVITPEDLTFDVPIRVTVPFDMAVRNLWETPDDECRVWVRDGEGWTRANPVASSETAVTIELDQTASFAAGVFTSPLPLGCRFNCAPPAPPVEDCRDGDFVCLERIGDRHVSAVGDWYSYTQGTLYWLTAPSSGALALAGFDTLNRRAITTSGALTIGSGATPVGEVVVDGSGARWIGLSGRANVRFEGTRAGQAFDSFARSTDPRAIGVVYEPASREAIRVRAEVRTATSTVPLGQIVTTVQGGVSQRVAEVFSSNGLTGVLQMGRVRSSLLTFPLVMWGPTTGTFTSQMRTSGTYPMIQAMGCGGVDRNFRPLPVRQVLSVGASPGRSGFAMLCLGEDNRGALMYFGGVRASFDVNQTPRGVLAVENDGTIWIADRSRPQLIRSTADGALTGVPLTSVRTDDPEYSAMVPISVHYDSGLDVLVLVTRGEGGVPRFYQIDNLP